MTCRIMKDSHTNDDFRVCFHVYRAMFKIYRRYVNWIGSSFVDPAILYIYSVNHMTAIVVVPVRPTVYDGCMGGLMCISDTSSQLVACICFPLCLLSGHYGQKKQFISGLFALLYIKKNHPKLKIDKDYIYMEYGSTKLLLQRKSRLLI